MNSKCLQCGRQGGLNSSYVRSSDRIKVKQYRCRRCRVLWSDATFCPEKGQKKRSVNQPLSLLLGSAVCLSRAARILNLHPTTVARKLIFLASQARVAHLARMGTQTWEEGANPANDEIYLDEMITYEHTRCKPLAVAMIVNRKREILALSVQPMPAIGKHLKKIALKKYGKRPNFRGRGVRECLTAVKHLVPPTVVIRTDEHHSYANLIREILPHARHERYPSKRAVIAGQGELKDKSFDPLFAINHTFAMIRAFVSRLVRRTWANTKKLERLRDHLWIYADLHNHDLIGRMS